MTELAFQKIINLILGHRADLARLRSAWAAAKMGSKATEYDHWDGDNMDTAYVVLLTTDDEVWCAFASNDELERKCA